MQKDGVIQLLRDYIYKEKITQQQAADRWGCNVSMVWHVLRGVREPTKAMLDSIGYERVEPVVTYRRKKKEKTSEL